MPAWLIPAITGAASIAGSALGKSRTKTLINREQQLTNIQSDANKSLAMFNNDLQMKMWEKTGPVGQMEQLGKAGLNAGLMYGMSGAGGGTVQAAQAQGVGKGSANDRTKGDDMAAMGLATMAQIGLMNAQTKNINADTAQKLATTEKTKGETTTIPIQQENIKAETENRKLQAEMQNIQNKIAGDTAENAIATAGIELQRQMQDLEQQVRSNYINEETKNTEIQQRKTNLITAVLHNKEIQQKIRESNSNIQLNDATIQNMAKNITLKYDELYQSATHANRQDAIAEWEQFMKQQNIPAEIGTRILMILGLKAK